MAVKIESDGELVEVDEKTVDEYGRISVGQEHSGKTLKYYLVDEDQDEKE